MSEIIIGYALVVDLEWGPNTPLHDGVYTFNTKKDAEQFAAERLVLSGHVTKHGKHCFVFTEKYPAELQRTVHSVAEIVEAYHGLLDEGCNYFIAKWKHIPLRYEESTEQILSDLRKASGDGRANVADIDEELRGMR